MEEHGLIALLTCTVLHETGTASLYLHTTSRFLLDVLHICTTMTDDLRSEIEAGQRL